ncbi:MAG TPA: hypothetical protein VD813_03605 [Pseudonocardia sp.]|nr:hypothetical protein [Pseudonocardia sp.]
MNSSRAERRRRQHAESMARLRELTARPLPPRRARIRLATAYLTAAGVMAALQTWDQIWSSIAQLAVIAALAGLWVALRRATRLVTEAPDDALDELLVRLRNECFREAYGVLGTAAMLLAVVLIITASGDGLPPATGAAIGYALAALALGLPLVVAAVRLPDVGDEP